MKVEDFISQSEATKYFILDSHDKGTAGQHGTVFEDEDYVKYSYKPSINNRLVPGSVFLYRKPGRNFRITGGGRIESISETDSSGYNTALIANGFEFAEPIKKGDPFLENFQWKNKVKPGIGWKGFWTNYGMLEIAQEDFWGLVAGRLCRPGIANSELYLETVEDLELQLSLDTETLEDNPGQIVINDSAIARPEPVLTNQGKAVYPRDRKVSRNALNNAHHKCECDSTHVSFIRRGTNVQYCEPHHLIPMGFQKSFVNSLDREENVVSLCSNCHNQIHYGEGAKEILTKLYEARIEGLKRVGIEIDLETLLSMYNL